MSGFISRTMWPDSSVNLDSQERRIIIQGFRLVHLQKSGMSGLQRQVEESPGSSTKWQPSSKIYIRHLIKNN